MATQPQAQLQAASPPTSITIRDSDLVRALSARNTPAAKLFAIRTLRIVITESNLLLWHGLPWPGARAALDDDDLNEYARLYPGPALSTANSPPSEPFRELLRFAAERFDLGKLDIEVDAGSAAWSLFEDKGAGAYGGRDEVDQNWRFVYRVYLDVGRALAEVFGDQKLREVGVKTPIWDGMGVWLTGQIRRRGPVVAGELPRYHDTGTTLLSCNGGDA